MAYNEFLGERIGISLQKKGVIFEEKKMMGGLALESIPRAKSSKKKR